MLKPAHCAHERGHSLKRSLDDFLPHAVSELLLGDRNRFSIKLKRVVFRVEILDANEIAFHGNQGCRALFDFGAFRGVAFHCSVPGSAIIPTALAQILCHKTLRRNFSGVEHSAKLADLEHQVAGREPDFARAPPTLAIVRDGPQSYYRAIAGQYIRSGLCPIEA